jgi:hypothetical protein
MLKRDLWTNDEVINILEGCKIYIEDRDRKDKNFYALEARNQGIEQAIIQFCDFKADPEESFSAMAYDPLLKQIFVISSPMPQTEEEYQAYLERQPEKKNP